MNAYCSIRLLLIASAAGLGTTAALAQTYAEQERRSDDQRGVEVLTRGPVHEAFAATITFDPDPGVIVSKGPPDAIEELPPDQRPDGDNIDWIPGYWAWDDERNDFIWISGVWRAMPPGREWVPGYWGRSQHGYQWTAGYWADADAAEIEYLPEPPESVEIGPNIGAPSADHSWMPGTWVWSSNRYLWRPGCWLVVQPNWDWTPAHYVWAPRGYVFVDGYWDYSVRRRGVLFAPVYFEAAVYARPNFVYAPSTVISVSVFSDHLFVRPQYSHYYFGDYYAPSYRDSGFYASFSFQSGRRGYEPFYTHERWQHRQDPEWDRRVQANFNLRRENEDARPRRTLAAQVSFAKSDSRRGDRSFALAASVEQASRGDRDGMRFRGVDKDERQHVAQRAKDVTRFREERQRAEVNSAAEGPSERAEPLRMKARRSPIIGKRAEQLKKDDAPPQKPETPQADPKVERKQRKTNEKKDRPEKP